ncbi:MAG TPA: hypothetical protein VN461_14075 [Vicinamibacteria bacterium]|nr:hypothetical protein [Vicinamibacteria bacterium]
MLELFASGPGLSHLLGQLIKEDDIRGNDGARGRGGRVVLSNHLRQYAKG